MSANADWRSKASRTLRLLDASVVGWAVTGAYFLRFGVDPDLLTPPQQPVYLWWSIALAVAWWLALGAWNSRHSRILGAGPEEYKRVAAASLWLFGMLAIMSYLLRADFARGYVAIALPVGLLGLLAARWFMRQHLNVDRQRGGSMSRLLLIGGEAAVAHLAASLERGRHAGYLPVAAYTPGAWERTARDGESGEPLLGPRIEPESGLPILGHRPDTAAILEAIELCNADAVALSAGVQLHPQLLRHLGWELAARNIGLIMAPALTDIAGPRIHTQQVAGLPLIHVTTPTLDGGQRVVKRLFDVAASACLLLILSPVLAVVALIIKLDSRGPIFFVQERVGVEGSQFRMFKFRSMAVDAEERLAELAHRSQGNGVLFKMKNDPRVTRVGRVLRKLSIDELPQLINVLDGSMSLVGPRPPLPQEVEAYEQHVRRRLLVKPGLTGLWQVSGRSNLSWQDSVRLDLYYVENWSLAGDLIILLRTFRAVFRSTGAY
ncbi:sugar transferase [Pseudarthrobacter sp. L19]|uniref:sugar transferase n=1 Tax=Pseudarthrobacter sp. L19 TaxID=3423951 RepID=UPI003D7AB1E0